MMQGVVTRSQRRLERKQVVLIVVLIFSVAGVSFFLGVLFGQSGCSLPGLSADARIPKLPMVTRPVPPPPAETSPQKLTFYDSLPKGRQAPLGSGINLPPEQQKTITAVKKKTVIKPAELSSAPRQKPVTAPTASSDGAFVVQVASFRTSEDARKLAIRLKDYNLTTFVESADLGNKGVWYRVLTGPYGSREKADQTADLLREKERLSALVRRR
jgi:cell division protein FtsN